MTNEQRNRVRLPPPVLIAGAVLAAVTALLVLAASRDRGFQYGVCDSVRTSGPSARSLVIVVEDDPQGGRDHVEAHRSILMMIGPYVKRGYVSHTLANFGSIMRLIFTVLDVPPLNQFDATATLLLDFFQSTPDERPYALWPIDRRLRAALQLRTAAANVISRSAA